MTATATMTALAESLAAAPGSGEISTVGSFPYLKAEVVLTKLNSIFGTLAWSAEIVSCQFLGERECKISQGDGKPLLDGFTVLFQTHARLTIRFPAGAAEAQIVVRDGFAIGSGQFVKGRSPDKAYNDAAGESVTDAIRRAAKTLGPAFGLGLKKDVHNGSHGNNRGHGARPQTQNPKPETQASSQTQAPSPRCGSLVGKIKNFARKLHGDDVDGYLERSLKLFKAERIEALTPGQQSQWADSLEQELKSRAPSGKTDGPLEVKPSKDTGNDR